jgi:hypothetical protein
MKDRTVNWYMCVGGYLWEGGNGEDEGEGIWLMGFIYIYEIER